MAPKLVRIFTHLARGDTWRTCGRHDVSWASRKREVVRLGMYTVYGNSGWCQSMSE